MVEYFDVRERSLKKPQHLFVTSRENLRGQVDIWVLGFDREDSECVHIIAMHLGSSELEPPLVLAILREEARGLVLRARDERHLVLIPVQVGDLPEVALESELRDPPSLVVSLPLVHGSVEGVSEDLSIVTQELRSIICVFVALHGSEG